MSCSIFFLCIAHYIHASEFCSKIFLLDLFHKVQCGRGSCSISVKCQQRFAVPRCLVSGVAAMAPGPCDGVPTPTRAGRAESPAPRKSVVADENVVLNAQTDLEVATDAKKILQEPKMISRKVTEVKEDVVAPAVALQARSKVKMVGIASLYFCVFVPLVGLVVALLGNETARESSLTIPVLVFSSVLVPLGVATRLALRRRRSTSEEPQKTA